jgi:fructose-1,6-bisphosphatase/inositol monophosphatase family enzyme
MITEAGGTATDLHGGSYHPGGPDLLVSNSHIHAEMQQMMAEVAAHATKI